MKITKYLVDRNTFQEQGGGLVLSLKKLELGHLTKLSQLTHAQEVTMIELDGNFLKDIDENEIREFTRLTILNVPMNFLTRVSSLTCLITLQQLDISANRLKLLNDISMLTVLTYLKLPINLKVIKGGNNQLDEMGYLVNLQCLQVVVLNDNNIEKMTQLAQCSKDLRILDLERNNIPKGQFPNLLIIIERYAKNLKELVLVGNEIVSSENYVLQILRCRPVEKLDNIIITPYILKAFTEIKQQKDIVEVMKETHSEYLKRIKDELEAKDKIINTLKSKQQQVQNLFRQYRQSNAAQLDSFVDYCNKGLIKDGKNLQYEHEVIMNFEKKLKSVEDDNNTEARARKRKFLEDQRVMASKLQVNDKKELYSKPGYKPLPNIDEAKQVSIQLHDSESNIDIGEEYSKRQPILHELQGLHQMVDQRNRAQQPSSESRQSSNPNSSQPSKESLLKQFPKRDASFNSMQSKDKQIFPPVLQRESVKDTPKINKNVEKTIRQSKRASILQRQSKLANDKSMKPLKSTQNNLFAEECWDCFRQHYSQIKDYS